MNALALALAAGLLAQAAPKDRVTTKKGAVVEGKVTKETFKEVAVQVGASTQTVPGADVLKVEYFDAPPAFKGAMAAVESEKWAEANSALGSAEEYANSKEKGIVKPGPWFPQHLAYWRGFCQMQLGQLDNALKNFEKVRKEFKDSRFLAPSFELALQALREKGNSAGMEAVEKEIEAAPGEIKAELQMRSRRQRAELLYDQNKYAEAKQIFDALKTAPDPEVQEVATGGIIRCLQGLKDAAGLETFCKNVLTTAGQPGLLLVASNALGDIQYEKKAWGAAKDHYVQSVVRFNPGRSGSGIEREHERAIYRLAKCYEELMNGSKDAKAKELYQVHAASAYREVSIEYPTGRFRDEALVKAVQLEPKDKDEDKKKDDKK
jgi:tetratricopeptide (TPR) repeat protein